MDKKHYVIVSLTLGLIGGVAAGLIGVANLVTKDKIRQNEIDKINNGIKEIYGENAIISAESTTTDAGLEGSYKFVSYVYTVKDNNEKNCGYAFRTTGSNEYGKISLIIGFDEATHGFKRMVVIVNEQTYASTLVDNYIDLVNAGERDIADVKCGATYGAKLTESMINEAQVAANEIWKE